LLTSAIRALDEIDRAVRELDSEQTTVAPVRLGAFPAAVIGLVPAALRSLPAHLKVTLREATTPALTRALRARTLDLAILARSPPFRPLDAESPPLELTTLSERELVIGVAAGHPLASAPMVEVRELEGQVWVARRSDAGDSLLGVWPGLAHRPDVRYVVRDWLAKLSIVAAGLAITTVAPVSLDGLPDGIRVLAVRGEPRELRRIVLARQPGPMEEPTARVADALIATARGLRAAPRAAAC
jgi:DNA-binding transcriptional LysR family regulator